MQRRTMQNLLATVSLLAIAACTGPASQQAGWHNEAGGAAAYGFGNSTMNNHQIQTGQRNYAHELAARFAAEVPSTINFAFNSAELDGTAQAVLRKQAHWMHHFPELRFRIFGHTDLVGSNAANRRLGLRRAQAAVRYLGALGIPRSRVEALTSFGETKPLVLTQQPARQNRRTVTQVSGFVQRHPTVLNGKYAAVIFRDYVESAVEAATVEAATPAR